MNFPKLNSMRILTEEEMEAFKGGKCDDGCKRSCYSSCSPGCSPGNKNNNQGNGNSGSIDIGPNGSGVF